MICRASLQDAPLIVLAVNSHANLVAALNRVIDDYDATGCDGCGVISQETFNAVVAAYQDAKPPVALKAAQPNATPSPASKWEDNALQFPRLIEEAQAAGAFTPEVVNDMAVSMDLDSKSVNELIDRAGREFERIKASL